MISQLYSNTFVTCLTAQAPGAIGVMRIWGAEALAAADAIFLPRIKGRSLSASPTGFPRLGTFAGDEVVAVVFQDGASVTGREVEIQCHGSPLVLRAIIEKLAQTGVVEASAEIFQKEHGILWLERLAMRHLGEATSPKAVALLWQQQQGALRRQLHVIIQNLNLERIDFAIELINQLIATSAWATRLSSGFRVALAGPPNVGKSSLANALAGYERVVVSPTPGTTRDIVALHLTIGGWPIILTDTAGLREETNDPLEMAGITMARQEHQQADLVLQLTEATEMQSLLLTDRLNLLNVLTKTDLVDQIIPQLPCNVMSVSAQTGAGLDKLMISMIHFLIPIEFQTDLESEKAILFDFEILDEMKLVLGQIKNNHIKNAIERLHEILMK